MVDIVLPSGHKETISHAQARAVADSIRCQCQELNKIERICGDEDITNGIAVDRRTLMRRHKATKHEVESAMRKMGAEKQVDQEKTRGPDRVVFWL